MTPYHKGSACLLRLQGIRRYHPYNVKLLTRSWMWGLIASGCDPTPLFFCSICSVWTLCGLCTSLVSPACSAMHTPLYTYPVRTACPITETLVRSLYYIGNMLVLCVTCPYVVYAQYTAYKCVFVCTCVVCVLAHGVSTVLFMKLLDVL